MSRCKKCKFYEPLHKPRRIRESTYIYGFCFKDFHADSGSIYPVYLPDGGVCKEFTEGKDRDSIYEYEMSQEFHCECCKKNLISRITGLINKGGTL